MILDSLRPSYTHKSNFIRALGTLAVGLAGAGKAHQELLPIFEERIADGDSFVATNAMTGLAKAFSESGNREAVRLLEPYVPFPVTEIGEDEPQRVWHFRWRQAAACSEAAASALARIGRNSPAENQAVGLLRQYLRPENVPPEMGFEAGLFQRWGVWTMGWLLCGKPAQALAEMQFLLPCPKPDEPKWARRVPRSAAIWTLPGAFADSGAEGIKAAMSLLEEDEHPTLRTGLLSLGVAARANCDEKALTALTPFLSHSNGAVRDVANLAVGLVCHKSGSGEVLELLRSTNLDDRRGPSTNYPLGVGLVFQGTGDQSVAASLIELLNMKRRRLAGYAALAVGLVYQGTSDPQAADLLLPLLESGEQGAACEALQLVDFDEDALAEIFLVWYCLADGPGAAREFLFSHFLDLPPNPQTAGWGWL